MTDDTATIERDLAAVDAALENGAAGHDDPVARELQELALRLSAEAPEPRDRFADELRVRVHRGFPRRARTRRARERARRILVPVAGVGVPLAIVVAAIFAAGGPDRVTPTSGGGDDAGSGGGGGAAESAPIQPDAAVSQGRGSTTLKAVPTPRGGNFVPGQLERRIERTFSLELEVPTDELARVADGVTEVTNRHGGFVLDSSVSTGRDGGGGDFSLRIPSDRLRPALRDLGELAPVIRQSQEGRDVTRQHVTAKDRLQAARAERRSLLRRLELADTDEEAEALRRQLDLVSGEINGLRAQLRDLRLRTDYAVVNVSLLVAGDRDEGGVGSFGDALDDAGSLLVGFAGVLIRVLALGVPLALIALAAWLGSRTLRRRRRESALA